jgi:gamma-butyrobetaine dioxygenase
VNSISKLEKNSNYLKIIWDDGEESKFNYLWLRDNCPTAHDKDSRHRMFNILEVSTNINPKSYSISKNGSLEIEWSEGDHKSSYDSAWLREKFQLFKSYLG